MDWQIGNVWGCADVICAGPQMPATRKSLGEMCLICLWADLGPTWARSEANLHSIRPDKHKTDPKWIQNGAKMVPYWTQNGAKIQEFLKPNPPKMKTKSNEAWIKTSVKFLMLLSAPWEPRDPRDPKDPQGPQGPQGLSLIHIWRCRRSYACRSRWSPYH